MGELLFLALCLNEQIMRKAREEKAQWERKTNCHWLSRYCFPEALYEFPLSPQPPRETGVKRIIPFHRTQN